MPLVTLDKSGKADYSALLSQFESSSPEIARIKSLAEANPTSSDPKENGFLSDPSFAYLIENGKLKKTDGAIQFSGYYKVCKNSYEKLFSDAFNSQAFKSGYAEILTKNISKEERDAQLNNLVEGTYGVVKDNFEKTILPAYKDQLQNEALYKSYMASTGFLGGVAEWSQKNLGGANIVKSAYDGIAKAQAEQPLIEAQLGAKKEEIEATWQAKKKEIEATNTVTLEQIDKKGGWDKLVADVQAGASEYGARYQALGNLITTLGGIEQAKIQAKGQLEQISFTHQEDFIAKRKTDLMGQADQLLLNRDQKSFQDIQRGKLLQIMANNQEIIFAQKSKIISEESSAEIDKIIEDSKHIDKTDLVKKVKADNGGKLPIFEGKEITPDKLVELVTLSRVNDVFKEYENKLGYESIKSVNGLKHINNSQYGGVEWYLNPDEKDDNAVHFGKIDEKYLVKSRKDKGDGTYDVTLADGSVSNVNKNRVFARVSLNSSGAASDKYSYFYVNDETGKDIETNSSGNRVDLFFGVFKNSINNNPNLTEEEKEKKLANVQNGLEAIMGGSQKLLGVLFLIFTGQAGPLWQSVKEVMGGFKKHKQEVPSEVKTVAATIDSTTQVIELASFEVLKSGDKSSIEVTKDTADKFQKILENHNKNVPETEKLSMHQLMERSFGSTFQASFLAAVVNKVSETGKTIARDQNDKAEVGSQEETANQLMETLDKSKKALVNNFISQNTGKAGPEGVAASFLDATKDNKVDPDEIVKIKNSAKGVDNEAIATMLQQKYGIEPQLVKEILESNASITFSKDDASTPSVPSINKVNTAVEQVVLAK